MTDASDIMELETAFWQSMVDQTPGKAAAMLTEEAANVAMYGIHHFSPSEYARMADEGPIKLTGFSFSDARVIFPHPDVAVATYKVTQRIEVDGASQEMTCFDTTTWVKDAGTWRAAVHTETPEQRPPSE